MTEKEKKKGIETERQTDRYRRAKSERSGGKLRVIFCCYKNSEILCNKFKISFFTIKQVSLLLLMASMTKRIVYSEALSIASPFLCIHLSAV